MEAKPSIEPKYLFALLVFTLVIGLAFVLNEGSRQEVIANWSERRCDLDVMIGGFLYKPPDNPQSASSFGAENFKFCISAKTTSFLETTLGPLFEVLKKQMNAAGVLTQIFKVLRGQLNNTYKPFSDLMNKFMNKFNGIGSLASRIFQHLFMAMKKASAAALASIFVAISLQTAFMNSIDFIIKVIMIVLYILMGLLFVFFLPILPLLVLVLITVSGIETALPGSTGPMGSIFCFHKNTRIIMKSGDLQQICLLRPGDILHGGIVVQAVIEVPGETLYDLDGILVSGYHCLYHEEKIIYVKDHPRAVITSQKEETLWTLITDKREIPIMGSKGSLRFLDWDEIPDTKEAEKAWELVASEILNLKINKSVPTSAPCLDRQIKVLVNQGGLRSLSQVKIGDFIYGHKGWTRVVGKSERIVHTALGSEGQRMTDGNWILQKDGTWNHPSEFVTKVTWQGVQLITDTDCFKIFLENGKQMVVRDFTEVGSQQILKSHTRVEYLLQEEH